MRNTFSAMAAIGSALLASACCILPALAIGAGIGGSVLGISDVLAPWRPVFIAAALVALALGWWQVFRPAKECTDRSCAPVRRRRNAWIMALVSAIAVPLLAFPELAAWTGTDGQAAQAAPTVTLALDGLTCQTCATNVQEALEAVPGVHRVRATYVPPRAEVWADPSVSVEQLIAAVRASGYRVTAVHPARQPQD